MRQPKVGLAAPIAAEVRGYALAEIDALADVDGQRIVAEEAIYARRFGNRVEAIGWKLRRQARNSQNAPDGILDRVGRNLAIQRL